MLVAALGPGKMEAEASRDSSAARYHFELDLTSARGPPYPETTGGLQLELITVRRLPTGPSTTVRSGDADAPTLDATGENTSEAHASSTLLASAMSSPDF